jgi:hypothetical protein
MTSPMTACLGLIGRVAPFAMMATALQLCRRPGALTPPRRRDDHQSRPDSGNIGQIGRRKVVHGIKKPWIVRMQVMVNTCSAGHGQKSPPVA